MDYTEERYGRLRRVQLVHYAASCGDRLLTTWRPVRSQAELLTIDAQHLASMGWGWAQHRVPDPVDYIEMRRRTFGSDMTMSLARLRHEGGLPAELLRSGPVRGLENAAQDYATLLNDLFSYRKEVEVEGEVHNGVLVVQTFFDCDYQAGVSIIDDLMRGRLRQFLHVKEHELPVLAERFGLDESGRGALDAYVRELEDWLAGILHWHRSVRRYRDEDIRSGAGTPRLRGTGSAAPPSGPATPVRPGGPVGLGTSAARVAGLFTS